MKYSPKIVCAFFESEGLPKPEVELRFHPERKWRFDFAWPGYASIGMLALEVQGGIWIQGGHNRGAQMLKDYEKYNHACMLGWRILFVTPEQLCMVETADMIKKSLGI